MDKIDLRWGDTDLVPVGGGTMGSRSLQQGGAAVQQASIELVAKAKDLAAKLLEANVDDVVLDKDAGAFHVAGTPAVARTWADLAVAAKQEGTGLGVDTVFEAGGATFPFGAHVAVVEVDTDTGQVRPLRHVALDDAGRVLNPLHPGGPDPRWDRPGHGPGPARGVPLRRRRQPRHRQLRRLRLPVGGRAAELRDHPHGDADADQPARRQGHRRVGHDRLHAGRAVGRVRRPARASACATWTCRRPARGCGRPSRRPRARPAERFQQQHAARCPVGQDTGCPTADQRRHRG